MRPYSCNEVDLCLEDYSAGMLSEEDQQAVSAHLASCPACQKALMRVKHLDDLLKPEPLPVPLLPMLHDEIKTIAATHRRRHALRSLRPLAACLILFLFFPIILLVARQSFGLRDKGGMNAPEEIEITTTAEAPLESDALNENGGTYLDLFFSVFNDDGYLPTRGYPESDRNDVGESAAPESSPTDDVPSSDAESNAPAGGTEPPATTAPSIDTAPETSPPQNSEASFHVRDFCGFAVSGAAVDADVLFSLKYLDYTLLVLPAEQGVTLPGATVLNREGHYFLYIILRPKY